MEYLEAFSLISPEFWAYLIYFFVSVLIAWTIPGIVVTQKIRLPLWQKLTLATCIGIIFWGWQGWIFGLLQIRWASFVYLGSMLIAFFRYTQKTSYFQGIRIQTFDIATIALLSIGIIAQQIPVWHQGIRTEQGIGFCCEEPIDGLWNISVTDQLVKNIPPETPGFSGTQLTNYHFWAYLVTADLIRVFHLPLLPTQLQYLPLLISILYGLMALTVGSLWLKTKTATRWLLFWIYFATDFFPLARLHVTGSLNFTITPLLNSWMFVMNFPMALSIVLLLAGFFVITTWEKQQSRTLFFLMALIAGSLVGYKVHTGIFMLLGLAWLFIFTKKFSHLGLFAVSCLIAAVIYFPQNHGSGGLYFSWFSRMAEFSALPELGYGQTIIQTINFPAKLLTQMPFIKTISYIFTGIFLTGLYLTTYFGFYSGVVLFSRKDISTLPNSLKHLFFPTALLSLVLGLFTQQTSGGGHTYNFIAIVYWVMPFIIVQLFLPEGLYHRSRFWRGIILIFITVNCIRLIPLVNVYLQGYNTERWFTITAEELGALDWARKTLSPNTTIIVDPNNRQDAIAPYVSVFSQRPGYYSGRLSNLAHNVTDSKKQSIVNAIFSNSPCEEKKQTLRTIPNAVLYVMRRDVPEPDGFICLEAIYENNVLRILR